MAVLSKIDSNGVGLRYSLESSLGVLPAAASQFWFPFEPNTYSDFGGQITTKARNPINPSRQRKKGVVVDLDASGGFDSDLTQTNLQDILQGFFFANLRRKYEWNTGLPPTRVTISVTTSDDSYNATGIGTGTFVGDLLWIVGTAQAANAGLKRATTVTADKIIVFNTPNLVDETAPATSTIVCVGFQFAVGDATIVVPGGGTAPRLVSIAKDLTQLGLIPGEWVFVGGDTTLTKFALNAPFRARIRSISATVMEFDKSSVTLVADDGTSTGIGGTNNKTIQIFKGRVIKNESGSNIVRRSFTLERILGANNDSDLTKQQAEYLNGTIPSELTLTIGTADFMKVDMKVISLNNSTKDENILGPNTLLSKAAVAAGSALNAPPIVEADAFNTSSDVSRIKLSTFTAGTPNPSALFAFATDLTITVNNTLKPNKAIGVLGAFEVTAGTFVVSGAMTAYFADVAAVEAVKANADVTLDVHLVKSNAGIVIDIPLITLGNARLNVQQDEPITLPLTNDAASGAKILSTQDHTLLMCFFDYLPTIAD